MPPRIVQAEDLSKVKAALRRQVRASRASRGTRLTASLNEAVAAQLNACLADAVRQRNLAADAIVAAFCSTPLEPPTEQFLNDQRSAGRLVYLPVPRDGGLLSWAPDDGGRALHPTLRVPMPTSAIDPRPAPESWGACILPAAAVSRDGVRLGWGGGFYDRFLATCSPKLVTIAVVHDDEILDAIPREPHDVAVDRVVTPSGWFSTNHDRLGCSSS